MSALPARMGRRNLHQVINRDREASNVQLFLRKLHRTTLQFRAVVINFSHPFASHVLPELHQWN